MRNILQTFNANQTAYRAILSQLLPNVSGAYLDYLLISIDSDTTSPLRVDATSTPSLIINVGPSVVANPQSSRNRSIPFINSIIPSFISGSVTFPSSSGNNITTSTGGTTLLTLPSGDYVQVLIMMDSLGHLSTVVGTPNVSPTAASVPSPNTNTLPVAYVLLHNISGTIQNISQSNIFQIVGGSSSSSTSSSSLWISDEVSLLSGTTSLTVNFLSPQKDTSYVIFPMLENLVDVNPQFQQPEVTIKTRFGFTVQWAAPLDTGNYILSYIIPPKTNDYSEISIGSGLTSSSSTLFKAVLNPESVAVFQNLVDSNPQFQPIVGTIQTEWQAYTPTTSGFTLTSSNARWRLMGGSIEIEAMLNINTVSGTEAQLSLPSGFITDSSLPTNFQQFVGSMGFSGIANTSYNILVKPSVTYINFSDAASNGLGAQVGTDIFAASSSYSLFASIPIIKNFLQPSKINFKWNGATDSSNYKIVSMTSITGTVSIPNGSSSVSVPLPVDYGTTSYGIIATTQNAIDSNPQFQPLLVTAKTTNSATISWPTITDTGNYMLAYYVISLTT